MLIIATEDNRKCLINFWGYFGIRRRLTALKYYDPSPDEKKRRLNFLNKVLCANHTRGKLIYFGQELRIGQIFILDNMHYAVVSNQIMGCSYIALYSLDELDDRSYIPVSYCLSVSYKFSSASSCFFGESWFYRDFHYLSYKS